jgi:hypothetical protein
MDSLNKGERAIFNAGREKQEEEPETNDEEPETDGEEGGQDGRFVPFQIWLDPSQFDEPDGIPQN